MNRAFTLAALATLAAASTSLAGAGAGPWANGAYYPGQLDGAYSANIFNGVQPPPLGVSTSGSNQVVSGVLGFGINSGTPTVGSNSPVNIAGSSFLEDSSFATISQDSSLNYFVVYIDGSAYAGQTTASANLDTKTVSGALWNGIGNVRVQERQSVTVVINSNNVVANTNPVLFSLPGDNASGYFNANITSDKGLFTFTGPGAITITPSDTNAVTRDFSFLLTGIKVSESGASRYAAESSTTGQ